MLRPRGAYDVAAMVAFVLAIGGASAFAAGTIGAGDIRNDAVRSRHIRDGAVENQDLAGSSVGTAKAIDGSLQARDFKPGALDAGAPHYVTWDLAADREAEEKTIVQKGPLKLSAICRQDLTSTTDKVSMTILLSAQAGTSYTFTAAGGQREANGFGRAGTAGSGASNLVVANVPRQTSFYWYGGAPFSVISSAETLDGVLSYGVLSYHHCEVSFFGG
jgi:hypothetical protein